ncbi:MULTISPECIES: mechanosensitive ion channel family protein [unclassified Campylobacter]|uniref:mechanosensitive ion channel family protein n=1 Tax=unclassified Campylobacter TaxID=2593542 RepID=UPI0022E9E246|nr:MULTISPECIES: mechanosensitive ion channel domain-containing protein [unclassified Campylobacter]MDA3042467.1 mechanosensitive ion channel [Campylobacter sp. JMF_09 ED2]MDA3044719.1 mechanosensitive ion channel [Campylobacter sp. JMF_07 ED4]MDA3063159.1 mechanosensitive ion channel [Campylobacter sp. JMF_11 EL3]MDA3071696.1 mechanosensitive ion channel [Campylobacter sp. VBCF_03 NA9]MDA3074240.1 mechanosensitive ion channel [Campylobacter sp. JMF_05 ED3]
MNRFLTLFLFFVFAFGEGNLSENLAEQNLSLSEQNSSATRLNKEYVYSSESADVAMIAPLGEQIRAIDEEIKNNLWVSRFANFIGYQELLKQQKILQDEQKSLSDADEINEIGKKLRAVNEQLSLLKEYEKSPFLDIVAMPETPEPERVSNPFSIITGFSTIRNLQEQKLEQKRKIENLKVLIEKLETKAELYAKVEKISPDDKLIKDYENLKYEIGEFSSAYELAGTTYDVYEKKINSQITALTADITAQIKRAGNILIWIGIVLALAFLAKFIAKRYVINDENFYLVNKIINVINFTIIVLILLFSYIDNMTHFVTVLGFASAGLAIAMKDMFMSSLGWLVIVFGGTFRVGDRVKVCKNGVVYVGDIIDISVLRMTIFEDVTMTTWRENKRAGRVVFIPNNYIFTDLLANYTHSGLKTVWDGIDILLTFDSNHKKAMYIIKNIVRKYSKGYTDIAKKQMSKLRSQYSIKNPNVEPRIFSFFEPYGIQISVWYMTNSYATLGLRSNISSEILESLQKEDDIKIAYPAYTLYNGKTYGANKAPNFESNEPPMGEV